MFRILRAAPLAVGFCTFRFTPREDSLVLVVKGTYRLEHGGEAVPIDEPEPLFGDIVDGDDPMVGACRYASDVVPFKPRADAMLIGKVHTPEGRAIPQCSASFAVGSASLSLLVTGDRYWLDPAGGRASEPRPFTEMPLGYERAFGGPGWAANPAGKGIFAAGAREAIDRPLPNIEDPREIVRRPQDRPAPAGFGPLSPHWAHRASKWPRVTQSWVEERWPWAPDGLDYGYFNAAQPALQIEGWLRGDETIVCENLHPRHRRFECDLPRVRPRAFVLDRLGDREHFREVGLRLDTLWVDMEAEKLVLVWRGSVPVASDRFEEVAYAYVATEPLDEPREPVDWHREGFELLRMEAEASAEPAAPPVNDNDAPAPKPRAPAAPRAAKPLIPPELRDRFGKMGVPDEVMNLLDRGDVDGALELARSRAGIAPEAFEKLVARSQEQLREALRRAGHDPALLDAAPRPKPRKAESKPTSGAGPWSRARVEAHLRAGGSLAGEDLSGIDLSQLDLRKRDLSGCVLRKAILTEARLDEAVLSGANLSGAFAERCSLREAALDEADLTGALLRGAVLAGADLTGAVLDDAVLAGAKLAGAKLVGAQIRRAELREADLSKSDLRGAHLDGAHLEGAVLHGADLTGASAEGMIATGVDFRGATLDRLDASENSVLSRAKLQGCRAERSRWAGADLREADLGRCNLRGADFNGADLSDAKLAGADCFEADFTRAKLRRASLVGANLWAGRLEEADLRRADLREASLYQAQLWRAHLEGADLEGAFTAGTLIDSPVRGWSS